MLDRRVDLFIFGSGEFESFARPHRFGMPEEDQEGELLKEESLYDVSASIHQIQRWPLVKRGYIDLTMYLGFFVLFIAIVLMQTEVTRG